MIGSSSNKHKNYNISRIIEDKIGVKGLIFNAFVTSSQSLSHLSRIALFLYTYVYIYIFFYQTMPVCKFRSFTFFYYSTYVYLNFIVFINTYTNNMKV